VSHQPPRLRILLVDDQPLFRKALASLIAGQFDFSVVGEASDGGEALEQVLKLDPDIVVMDVQMPGVDGIGGVRAIRGAGRDVPIVMLTISDEDDDLFEAIEAGANGYLLKNMRPEQIFDGIRGAARGEAPIAGAVAGRLLEALRHGGVAPGRVSTDATADEMSLTRREAEILQLISAGLSNKEIATRLTITEGTVKNHVHNALEKLHLTNRVQAAAYAIRHGDRRASGGDDPASG
jgi:two-component system, NarL family, nitrate/nitrite response regulator NarL